MAHALKALVPELLSYWTTKEGSDPLCDPTEKFVLNALLVGQVWLGEVVHSRCVFEGHILSSDLAVSCPPCSVLHASSAKTYDFVTSHKPWNHEALAES